MLSADLVRARRKKGELSVAPLSGKTRTRALELGEAYLAIARGHIGQSRGALRQAWSAVPVGAREKKLADGLQKLLEDACELAQDSACDPVELRRALFTAASEARREGAAGVLDRAALLASVGARFDMDGEAVERALYSDLKSAHTLLSVGEPSAASLVERYDRAQVQAVLLRAVRVTADVRCRSPLTYRAIFRALKFRRLLCRIEPRDRGYRILIDGPYSLFDSVTKYGLQLALVLPALMAADELDLTADVRWGKRRDRLTFNLKHRAERRGAGAREDAEEADDAAMEALPDEVRALVDAFRRSGSRWQVLPAADILDLPGVGLCVPDLVFEHPDRGRVYFEALGFWSRDAVWKRVELAQAGLPEKIVFAVSSRLRVSEEVLDDIDHAALYVYKGTLSARAVTRHLEAVAGGAAGARRGTGASRGG